MTYNNYYKSLCWWKLESITLSLVKIEYAWGALGRGSWHWLTKPRFLHSRANSSPLALWFEFGRVLWGWMGWLWRDGQRSLYIVHTTTQHTLDGAGVDFWKMKPRLVATEEGVALRELDRCRADDRWVRLAPFRKELQRRWLPEGKGVWLLLDKWLALGAAGMRA